jgi:2-C-methyl-D-erythritol 4-phosphate cytidylyltransferase
MYMHKRGTNRTKMEGKTYAVVVAAGKGKRMAADVSKQFMMLRDKPIVAHTLSVFDEQPAIDAIVLVVAARDIEYAEKNIVERYKYKKPIAVVEGGMERQKSVYNGLMSIKANTSDIVVIHDGVRPLVTGAMVQDSIDAARAYGAAVVGVPVKDTVKRVNNAGFVMFTPRRDEFWVVQTPQAFKYGLIREAHERAMQDGFQGTDDAVLVERLGHPVKMVKGCYSNIKITTREDLVLVQEFMNDLGGIV